MKRNPLIIAVLIFCGLSCYFLWAYHTTQEGLDPENDFANWQPTADVIRQSLRDATPAQREQAFAQLFQQRFRKHEPGKAIGVHFMDDGKIHLLTPARLEPWNINRIALMLHRETLQDFGKNYDINIYETFIGTPPVKIGELRPSPKTPAEVTVQYNYPAALTTQPPGSGGVAPRPVGLTGSPPPPGRSRM
jgi:hypothetical protein